MFRIAFIFVNFDLRCWLGFGVGGAARLGVLAVFFCCWGVVLILGLFPVALGGEAVAADAVDVKSNRLALEKSPYLRQHADNPVDWYPWGEEAFEKARREDKLIFLSVGYSTCHWCHVMERESFENPETAALMNESYVSIKVDREERPDVDKVYMTFVQATTGSGGWPMNVWLTPDLTPIFGGTYFPPKDGFGRPGFPRMLTRVAEVWKEQREEIVAQGKLIIEEMNKLEFTASAVGKSGLDDALMEAAFERLAKIFDESEGGFGPAPKFPRPATLNFLFHYYSWKGALSENGKKAREMALFTLDAMASGGIRDHLGGGFHRYSVDRFWHVPHFEKMLYDQAQLASAYLDAFQITGEKRYADVAASIFQYVGKSMTDATQGGFFSAEDADSLPSADSAEKSEGAYYIWSEGEVLKILGSEMGAVFNYRFGITSEGNAPAGSDPQGEFGNKNILLERHSIKEIAEKFGLPALAVEKRLMESRERLLAARKTRPRPHLDDKIITSWNGLMISAFARGSRILQSPEYLDRATRSAEFVKNHLYNEETGELLRLYRDGPGDTAAFGDDYAFLIQGLLDLYEASFEIRWLQWAVRLQETQKNLFYDSENGGFFNVTGRDPNILLRMKARFDGAEPSTNSVTALNLLRLGQITNQREYEDLAEQTLLAFVSDLSESPTAMPFMLVAYDFYRAKPKQIILAGKAGSPQTQEMLREVNRRYLPNKIVLLADGGAGQEFLGKDNESLRSMAPIGGLTTAFICENFVCQLPTNEVSVMARLLVGKPAPGP